MCANLRGMGVELAKIRDLTLKSAECLPSSVSFIVRMAAHLLEQARQFAEGEYTDPVAALALLPASVLGAHVRDQRVAANLSQRALARRTGLSINTLRDLERGQRTASIRTIQRLLQVSELALVTKPKLAAVDDAHHPSQGALLHRTHSATES